jgi:hypothetical protein
LQFKNSHSVHYLKATEKPEKENYFKMNSILIVVLLAFIIASINHASASCDESPDQGPCDAYLPRYYYNTRTGQCQMFIYGGCSGNGNNFRTKSECESACKRASLGAVDNEIKKIKHH